MNGNSKVMPAIIIGGIFALIFVGLGILIRGEFKEEKPLRSVSEGSEYNATSTLQMTGTDVKTDVDWLVDYDQYHGTILGSIIVATTTGHQLKIKNATTTSADGFYTNSSSTIATLPANLPQRTYTFDIYLDKGLVLDFEAGFCGDYIITWR